MALPPMFKFYLFFKFTDPASSSRENNTGWLLHFRPPPLQENTRNRRRLLRLSRSKQCRIQLPTSLL